MLPAQQPANTIDSARYSEERAIFRHLPIFAAAARTYLRRPEGAFSQQYWRQKSWVRGTSPISWSLAKQEVVSRLALVNSLSYARQIRRYGTE